MKNRCLHLESELVKYKLSNTINNNKESTHTINSEKELTFCVSSLRGHCDSNHFVTEYILHR